MKVSKLALACLLATSGLSVTQSASAATKDGIEFHGYFRAGALFSVEDDMKRAKFPAQKETLGRLGIESDNHYELALDKTFALDDGKSIKIKTRAGAANNRTANNQLGTNVDATDIGIMETFVEFGGLTDTGTFWAGKRFYGKDNYIFMTDLFYTDWSGTGLGIEGYESGDVKWDAAYIASDRSNNDAGRWGNDTNNTMHAAHLGANFGKFELHGVAKYLPDNTSQVGDDVYNSDWADTGFELTGIYTPERFFGLPGNGFSKLIAQVGNGLGSGQLLGGTLTTYNAYKPGSLRGQGPDFMTQVKEGDISARLLAWGGYFLESGINLFPALQAQYNDYDDGGSDYWASAMVQPTFPVSKNFFIASQLGYVYNHVEDASGNTSHSDVGKVTVAPTWTINTGMGPAPEIRLLATYLTDSGTNAGKHDFIVGMQADMWW